MLLGSILQAIGIATPGDLIALGQWWPLGRHPTEVMCRCCSAAALVGPQSRASAPHQGAALPLLAVDEVAWFDPAGCDEQRQALARFCRGTAAAPAELAAGAPGGGRTTSPRKSGRDPSIHSLEVSEPRSMIIAERFLWLHLPKTGGTSMNQLFRQRALPGVQVDADDVAAKHDSIALRESRGSWRAGERRRFITARRLEAWLISDWLHKRRHMSLPDLDFEPVRSGLFYSLRLGGTWVAADWWLQYFAMDAHVTPLRLEHLAADLNTYLLPLLPAGTEPFAQPPRANARPDDNPLDSLAFSAADRSRIASSNPRWSAWEQQIYGS